MTSPSRLIVPILLFIGIVAAGCAGNEAGTEYDLESTRGEIEANIQRFESFVAEQQWDSLMTLYTEDALFMPQNAETAEGNAIRDGFVQMGSMGVSGIDLETVDLELAGNTAYEVGRYTLEGPNGMQIDQGKYLVVWKNVDGEWKLHRDIFNTNQPMMPPAGGMSTDTTSADTSGVM